MRSSPIPKPSAIPRLLEKDALGLPSCPSHFSGARRGQVKDRRAPFLFPFRREPGVVILSLVSHSAFQFSCLLYSMQKSHFNACFSTDFSKSRLNFCFTSNHFWITEQLSSLIITVAQTAVCPEPLQAAQRGSSLGGTLCPEGVFTHSLFVSFCQSNEV